MRNTHCSVRTAVLIAIFCVATFELNVLPVAANEGLNSFSSSSSTPISVELLEQLAKKIEQTDEYLEQIKPFVKSVTVGVAEPWTILSEEELQQLEKDGLVDSNYRTPASAGFDIEKVHQKLPLYTLQYQFESTSLSNKKLVIDPKLLIEQADAEFDEIVNNYQWKEGNEFSPLQFVAILHTTCVNIALKVGSGLSKDTLLRRISFIISSPEVDESLNTRKLQSLESYVDEVDSSASLNAKSSFHLSKFDAIAHHPLRGGISFGPSSHSGSISGGTIGGILIDNRGQRYSLTNHHVAGSEGTISCQPSPIAWYDSHSDCYKKNECCPKDNQISMAIADSSALINSSMDWNVGKLDHSEVDAECRIHDIGYIAGVETVNASSRFVAIKKHGYRTHLTAGYILSISDSSVTVRSESGEWPAFANGNPKTTPPPKGLTYPDDKPFTRVGIVPDNERDWFAQKKHDAVEFIKTVARYSDDLAEFVFDNLYERNQTSLVTDSGDSGSWYVSANHAHQGQYDARALHRAGSWRRKDCPGSPQRWRDPRGNYWCELFKIGLGTNFVDMLDEVNTRIADRINSSSIIAPADRPTVIQLRTVRACTAADGKQHKVPKSKSPPMASSSGWDWP